MGNCLQLLYLGYQPETRISATYSLSLLTYFVFSIVELRQYSQSFSIGILK